MSVAVLPTGSQQPARMEEASLLKAAAPTWTAADFTEAMPEKKGLRNGVYGGEVSCDSWDCPMLETTFKLRSTNFFRTDPLNTS